MKPILLAVIFTLVLCIAGQSGIPCDYMEMQTRYGYCANSDIYTTECMINNLEMQAAPTYCKEDGSTKKQPCEAYVLTKMDIGRCDGKVCIFREKRSVAISPECW